MPFPCADGVRKTAGLKALRASGTRLAPTEPAGETYPYAPGLLKDYPELLETPSEGTKQRTEWNMRDADAILTIIPEGSLPSPGTDIGLSEGEKLEKPMLTISGMDDAPQILAWLDKLPDRIELCVGGPRESECRAAYTTARKVLFAVFENLPGMMKGKGNDEG